jgi:radical SAM protein with 4Fe4S-binding SPASM domain
MSSDAAETGIALMSSVQRWAHDRHVPLNATIELTQRCNIRCKHCYNFDRDAPRADASCDSDAPELSRDEILALITNLHAAGCFFLNFTGGEALLHPDLFTFMDHAASLNLAVGLLTNGVLLRPGMATQLARYPNLTRVAVSVYGATAATHDAITQAEGSFARTWAGMDLLRARNIPVFLKFIIMRDNAHEVAAMRAQAEARDYIHGFDLTITPRHDGTRGSLDQRIDLGQLEEICRGPLRDRQLGGPERTLTDVQFACNCARGNCAVTAKGDVQPCMSVPLVAGNIRQQPFAEIWRSSPVFQQIRGLRIADYAACAPCGHKSWCTRERGAAYNYSGSYTGTDPLVCARAEIAHSLADEAAQLVQLRR